MAFNNKFHISYFFRPFGTLLVCLLIVCVAIAVGIGCAEAINDERSLSIIVAIVTGLIASSVVALLIQIGDNYKSNTERSNELLEFFIALKFYEHLIAGHIESERRRKEANGFYDGLYGKLNATWRELDSVTSLLERCTNQKQRFLTLPEVQAIHKVFDAYAQIKRTVHTTVLMKIDRSNIPEYRLNATLAEAAQRLNELEKLKHLEDLLVADAVKNPDVAYHLLGIRVKDTMINSSPPDSNQDISVYASYEIAEYLGDIRRELDALRSLLSKDVVLRYYGKQADKEYLQYQQNQGAKTDSTL